MLALSTMPVRRRAGNGADGVGPNRPAIPVKLDWVEKFMTEELEPSSWSPSILTTRTATMAILRPLLRQVKRPGVVGRAFASNSADGASVRSSWRCSNGSSSAPGGRRRRSLSGRTPATPRSWRCSADEQKPAIDRCSRRGSPPLFDDRAAGVSFRSQAVRPRRPAMPRGKQGLDHQRREVVSTPTPSMRRSLSSWPSPSPEACTYREDVAVPRPTPPGIEIVRNVGVGADPPSASHGFIRYDVQVPADHVLGGEAKRYEHEPDWAAAEYIARCGQSRADAQRHSTA